MSITQIPASHRRQLPPATRDQSDKGGDIGDYPIAHPPLTCRERNEYVLLCRLQSRDPLRLRRGAAMN